MPNWTPEDEAHYTHVSRSAAQYDALKSKTRREAEERLKASKKAKDAEYEASLSRSSAAPAPKAAKPATAASTPKASTPKRDPEAEYLRGVASGRAAERTRIGKVYDNAKTMGGDAQALKLLATTDMDSAAINAKLYGNASGQASTSSLGLSDEVWAKAIANVTAQHKGGAA